MSDTAANHILPDVSDLPAKKLDAGSLPLPAPTDTSRISRAKFQEIILEKWVPGAIAAIVVSWAIPFFTDAYTRSQARETAYQERQYRLWEEVANSMTAWMNSQQQVVNHRNRYNDGTLVERILDGEDVKPEQRDAARAKKVTDLRAVLKDLEDKSRADLSRFSIALGVAEVFFDTKAQEAIKKFRGWHRERNDEQQKQILAGQLVLDTMESYVAQRAVLMEALRLNLKGPGK